ncbi:hypothetical protein U9M48_041796 [Paspalum notatum var. saurae]|uniref:Reverse transcriptase zinc-binding domain-containing protein n=1 Tax=Paspalum notatum var. saurae TaxID=547442 RepID=A0AAQ3UQ16_PASNO
MNLELREERDVFKWGLNKTGVFTVRSMYKHLINKGIRVSQEIWQTKIPLKTKIFMWYVKRGVLLTKDNLARRNWNGDQGCCLCNQNESIQHLFFDCLLAKAAALIWAIWLQRNDVLFRGTFWLRHWAKLQRSDDQVQG